MQLLLLKAHSAVIVRSLADVKHYDIRHFRISAGEAPRRISITLRHYSNNRVRPRANQPECVSIRFWWEPWANAQRLILDHGHWPSC